MVIYLELFIDTILDNNKKVSLMKDNCYICYCNEEVHDVYYLCENNHSYHHKFLISYYKKVNVDINCFYCKGKYNFSQVYKNY